MTALQVLQVLRWAEHERRRVTLVGQDSPHLLVLDELACEIVQSELPLALGASPCCQPHAPFSFIDTRDIVDKL